MKEFRIRELDLNLINPNNLNFSKSDQGGSKIVIIGKPGTGKTALIISSLREKKSYPSSFYYEQTEDSL